MSILLTMGDDKNISKAWFLRHDPAHAENNHAITRVYVEYLFKQILEPRRVIDRYDNTFFPSRSHMQRMRIYTFIYFFLFIIY